MSHDHPSTAIERAERVRERREFVQALACDLLVAMASSAEMNRDVDVHYARDVVGLPRDAAVMANQLAKELGL